MHSLICGVTLSGKTTLARFLSRELRKRRHTVFVYDPMIGTETSGGDWGNGCILFDKEEHLLKALAQNEDAAHVFIDESDELFHQQRRENFWVLTRGRHFLLSVNLITQRPNMISPTVRRQCTRLYMFRLALKDTREIAADYGFSGDELLEVNGERKPLDKGEFVVVDSGSHGIKRANVFTLLKGKSP